MKIEWILIFLIVCFSSRVYSFDFTVKFQSLKQFDQFQRIVADNLEFDYNYDHYFTSFEYFGGVRESVLNKGIGFNQREASRILNSIILSKDIHSRELFRLFLDQGVPPYVKDGRGWAPIHYAALVGRVDIVKELQSHGSALNAKNKDRNTALHIGVQEGHLEVVRYLLALKAGIHLTNKLGDTLLHTAVRHNVDEKMMELLLSHDLPLEFRNKKKMTALHLAVSQGYLKHVKILLDAGIFVDARDGYGNTALHVSVRYNHQDIAELLVKYGADIQAENRKKETPLYLAVVHFNKSFVRFLVEKGADVNGTSAHGETPVQGSIHNVDLFRNEKVVKEMIELLLEYHADLNKKYAGGETLLHRVIAQTDNLDIIKFVLEKGGDVRAVDKEKETPFLRASWASTSLKKLEMLLDYGSDIDAQDEDGNTALHNAVLYGNVELVEFLLVRGASTKIKNRKGQTPLELLLVNKFSKDYKLEKAVVNQIVKLFENYRKNKNLSSCSDAF